MKGLLTVVAVVFGIGGALELTLDGDLLGILLMIGAIICICTLALLGDKHSPRYAEEPEEKPYSAIRYDPANAPTKAKPGAVRYEV